MDRSEQVRDAQQRLIPHPRRRHARGRRRAGPRGGMNRTERDYATHLEALKLAGQIDWFGFESLKFKLADRCYYLPDFVLMTHDGELQLHEVKGHLEDDAAVKLRVMAREYWMFRLFIVRRKGAGWDLEERTSS